MPAGSVILHGARYRGVSQPGIDKIFESFRKKKTIKIKAKLPTKEERRWRPQGVNLYELEIISIERVLSVGVITAHDEYIAKAALIGMNGVAGKFPSDFSYPSKGHKNAIELRFNSKRRLEIEYHEYLSL